MEQDPTRCRMQYGKDEQGKDVLLKDGKFQVMMEWEKPYMHACIDALQPFGDVLEIGFGLGFSAERIQSYKPKSHTIIEFHPEVAAKARAWAQERPNVIIVEDTWQHALKELGVFDCIFFDDYPLQSEEWMREAKAQSGESSLLLQQGVQVIQEVEEQLPFLKEMRYSDADLREVMEQISLSQRQSALHFVRFLQELSSRKQITEEQKQTALQFLLENKYVQVEDVYPPETKKDPFSFSRTGDRLFEFLSACLRAHMHSGSRFSCFLETSVSRFEDEQFFNEVITNPCLDFQEQEIEIEVPANCAYFSGNKALVITITKIV